MLRIPRASTLCGLALFLASALDGCAPSGAPSNGGSTRDGTGGSASGAGGGAGTGGTIGGSTGGSAATGAGGLTSSGGVAAGAGSQATRGGSAGTNDQGGTTGAGGSDETGGRPASGGTSGLGGGAASGGVGVGGVPASGGAAGMGGVVATGGRTDTGPMGPCDIYAAANTPCGAAHSTVRSLSSAYAGPLYQVERSSDKATKDIMTLSDGFADSASQDTFCAGTSCTIPIIYDQTGNGNHLRVTWFAYWLQSGGNPAAANAAKISVGGHQVYGIKSGTNVAYRTGAPLAGTAGVTKGSSTVAFTMPQTLPANTPLLFEANAKDCAPNSWPNNCNFKAYYTSSAINDATSVTLTASYSGSSSSTTVVWNQATKGIATGDQPEAEYSVFDAKTYGQWCCFDYGNAELSGIDEGNATMEAISWAADTQFGQSGGGKGPWVGADLENGMFEGYENGSAMVPSNTSVSGWAYVTAMLKGLSAPDCPSGLTNSGCFALKAGDARAGKLEWKWNANTSNYGARPPGYSPQKKQGAIILATGGDGSNTGTGIWFEGAMTDGAPPDSVDDAVQANIVAAGYGQ